MLNDDRPYHIDHGKHRSIVIPNKVKYIAPSVKGGAFRTHHDGAVLNRGRIPDRKGRITIYHTPDCTKTCDHGFCMGHTATEQEFLDTYLEGELPPELGVPSKLGAGV